MHKPNSYRISHKAAADRYLERYHVFAVAAGLICIASGIVVLGLWTSGAGNAISFMRPNAAICFILGGISLWLLSGKPKAWPRNIAGFTAILMCCIALVSLTQDATGLDFALDELLIKAKGDPTLTPGRMAPTASAGFVLLGVAMLLLNSRLPNGVYLAQFLTLLAAVNSYLAIAGYMYVPNEVLHFGIGGLQTPMAPMAAFCFAVLGAGILCMHPRTGVMGPVSDPQLGGMMARRMLPFAILLPLVFDGMRVLGEVARLYDERFGLALFVTSIIIFFAALVWWSALSINRIDSQRRHAIELLSLQEERLRMVLKGAGITTWHWDAKTEGISWSDESKELFGVTREKLGTFAGFLAIVHPDHRDEFVRRFRAAIADRTEYSYKYRIVMPDGRAEWRAAQGRVDYDSSGNAMSAEGVMMDVHLSTIAEQTLQQANDELERKVAERTEELILAKDKAETADRHKSKFIASMSHELRTPLNAILGFTGTLLMGLPGPLTPEQRRQLETVRSSARHQLALINDLLDVAKIEAGSIEVNPETVNCNALVENVAATLRPLAEGKCLELVADIPEGPVVMRTDQRKLSQIIINLANNAIKFTEKGSVRISLFATVEGVEVAIRDTGVGLKAEHLQLLFQPFSRIENGLSSRTEGSGLGLHLSQMLAGVLGGKIEVESEVGKGSCFRLRLGSNRLESHSVTRNHV